MDEALKKLLINLKNHPWEHYPSYKVEEVDGKEIVKALKELEMSEDDKK